MTRKNSWGGVVLLSACGVSQSSPTDTDAGSTTMPASAETGVSSTEVGGSSTLGTVTDASSSSGSGSGSETGSVSSTSGTSSSHGSDSTSSGGETSRCSTSESGTGDPEPVDPTNVIADIEWVTPFVGITSRPTRILRWNDAPTVVVQGSIVTSLVFGEGLPSQTTVETVATSAVALATFDDATGAVTATRVLVESSTPDVVSPISSTGLDDVEVDADGVLTVAGVWTGEATFFPGTPDSTTRTAPASSTVSPDVPEDFQVHFHSAVLRIGPDGTGRWLAVSNSQSADLPNNLYARSVGVEHYPNGDIMMSGSWSAAGINFPDGTPGASTSEGISTFVARLDQDTGELGWIGHGDSWFHAAFSDSSGSAAYVVLEGANATTGTYFEGTPYEATLPFGDQVARLDPDGGLEWVVLAEHQDFGGADGVVACGSDGVAIVGYSGGGDVTLEGADCITASASVAGVFHPRAQWFGRIDADGSVLAVEALPEALRIGRQAPYYHPQAMIADPAGVWYGGYVLDFDWFEGDDIPELSSLTGVPALLIHLGHDGFVDETRVLGQGFDIDTIAWADDAQTRLLVSASYGCEPDSIPGLLVSGAPALQPLPPACSPDGISPRRGFVATVGPGGGTSGERPD